MTPPIKLVHSETRINEVSVDLAEPVTLLSMCQAARALRARVGAVSSPPIPGDALHFELSYEMGADYLDAICRAGPPLLPPYPGGYELPPLDGVPVVPVSSHNFQGNRLVWRRSTCRLISEQEI